MNILTECSLAEVVVAILDGKTIVFPTETSYGLGCDATNQPAVDKIFKIKGRNFNKPLLVVVPSVEMAKKYLVWNEKLEEIAKKYWPGAVTAVGEYAGGNLARGVVSSENTVAVRVTTYPLLKSLTEKIQRPLVATSANLAGEPELYAASEVAAAFEKEELQPDIILNYGVLPKNKPSTLVSVVNSELKILRRGEVYVDPA